MTKKDYLEIFSRVAKQYKLSDLLIFFASRHTFCDEAIELMTSVLSESGSCGVDDWRRKVLCSEYASMISLGATVEEVFVEHDLLSKLERASPYLYEYGMPQELSPASGGAALSLWMEDGARLWRISFLLAPFTGDLDTLVECLVNRDFISKSWQSVMNARIIRSGSVVKLPDEGFEIWLGSGGFSIMSNL